ncbi:MAG: hypothetical protein IJV39_01870 [Ruminococcus sp.]|nr:hypothetical protein [Ruminococcus sp.]
MKKVLALIAVVVVVMSFSVMSFSAACNQCQQTAEDSGNCSSCPNNTDSDSGCSCSDDGEYVSPVATTVPSKGGGTPQTPSSGGGGSTGGGSTGGGSGVSIVDVGSGKVSPVTGDNFAFAAALLLLSATGVVFAARKLVK